MANKGGFSWKRATGVSKAKSNISRKTGIPTTKSGRQRKAGSSMGCGIIALLAVAALTGICLLLLL